MKEDQKHWWHAWAPYWDQLEDRHLSTYETDRVVESLVEPVLVIGAGQGLVVDHLAKKGLRADGIDMEKEMAIAALRRRRLSILQGDARYLPIRSAAYNTVIVATGVVDYIDDDQLVDEILKECRRVLTKGGNLLISFFTLAPEVEQLYKDIGILTEGKWYRIRRVFELMKTLERGPLPCIKLVRGWNGMGFLSMFMYWIKVGLTLPKELKNENKTIDNIVEAASEAGTTREELFDNTPDFIPYRKEGEIEAIMRRAKLSDFDLLTSDGCITVKCHGAGLETEI